MKSEIYTWMFNVILALPVSTNMGEKHAKAIQTLGIEKNFKGFSYGVSTPESEDFTAGIMASAILDDDFTGVKFKVSEEGVIREIYPIIEKNGSNVNRIIWAVSKFEAGVIGIDSLWEVSRTSTPNAVSDVDVFRIVISLLKSDASNFRSIKFSKDGAFYKKFVSNHLPQSNSLDEVITHYLKQNSPGSVLSSQGPEKNPESSNPSSQSPAQPKPPEQR